MKKHSHRERGFSLLFAAIIATIVLSLGTAIFDIAIKQVELSSASQQSQYAFYAADTAAQCALYWSERYCYFATTTPATGVAYTCNGQSTMFSAPPSCDGQTLTISPKYNSLSPATYPYSQTFTFAPNGYCAQVIVTNNQSIGQNGTDLASTTIQANGYNVACLGITGSSALQRTVELNY